jgi:hypothetical protein
MIGVPLHSPSTVPSTRTIVTAKKVPPGVPLFLNREQEKCLLLGDTVGESRRETDAADRAVCGSSDGISKDSSMRSSAKKSWFKRGVFKLAGISGFCYQDGKVVRLKRGKGWGVQLPKETSITKTGRPSPSYYDY